MFKRIVVIVEVIALVSFGVFVLLLFIHQPESSTAKTKSANSTSSSAGPADGAAVYADHCAVCHGSKGQGGSGPELANGEVVDNFPNAADELDVVTNGEGSMPAFGSRLSKEELDAVVEYTRTGL